MAKTTKAAPTSKTVAFPFSKTTKSYQVFTPAPTSGMVGNLYIPLSEMPEAPASLEVTINVR